MLTSSRSYTIGSAHFQLAGGWRSMAWLCGGYVAVVLVALFIWKSGTSGPATALTGAVVSLAIVAQAVALLLFGSLRITKTVKTDLDTRMLESYRLMPIASWRAVLGYMFGSNLHTLAFAAVNLVLAYVFAVVTGSSMGQVTLAMAVLAVFVVFIWSAAAMGSFHGKVLASLISVIVMGTTMGGFFLYQILPAIALLLTPLAGESIFHVTAGPTRLHATYGVSLVAQGIFIVIFYRAACRAYRGTSATAFSIGQAIGLLLTWCGSSIAGIVLWDNIHLSTWSMNRGMEDRITVQVVASVIAGMLLVAAPLRTVIVASWWWTRSRRIGAIVATVLIGAVAITSVGLGAMNGVPGVGGRIGITAAVVVMHVVGLCCLLWVMRSAKLGPTIIALLIAGLVVWGAPLVVELFQYTSARDAYGNYLPTTGLAASFSPPGLLVETWKTGEHCSPVPALVTLLIVTAGFAGFTLKRRPKKKLTASSSVAALPVLSRSAITAAAPSESPEI